MLAIGIVVLGLLMISLNIHEKIVEKRKQKRTVGMAPSTHPRPILIGDNRQRLLDEQEAVANVIFRELDDTAKACRSEISVSMVRLICTKTIEIRLACSKKTVGDTTIFLNFFDSVPILVHSIGAGPLGPYDKTEEEVRMLVERLKGYIKIFSTLRVFQ